MFDQNFSFFSPSTMSSSSCASNDTAPSSPEISPLSSRCASPIQNPSHDATAPLAFRQRDDRFNSPRSLPSLDVARQPSITALAAELNSQILESPSNMSTPSSPLDSIVSTPNTDLNDIDEGFAEPDDHHISLDSSDGTFAPSLWDLSMADHNTTSSPSDFLPSFALRRRQRQALVHMQCLTRKAPDLAMLVEECHPSSLPMTDTGRPKTISGVGHRIEKERSHSAAVVKRMPKMRKRVAD